LTAPLILLQCKKEILLFSKHWNKMENTQNINITPEAAIAVKELLKDQDMIGHSLRIFIAGVG